VIGQAFSRDFPVTSGAYQTSIKAVQTQPGTNVVSQDPGYNAFVTKFNPSGTALVYSTFVGGSGHDSANAIVVDAQGSAYVAGTSDSPDYPVTPGVLQTTMRAPATGFVTKINGAGSALLYSTRLGGSGRGKSGDSIHALAIGTAGNAYVAGSASSFDFPLTTGAFQTVNQSATGANAFFAKLNPAGSGLAYSTYLGGSATDSANGVAVDAAGNAYVAGGTSSPNFPVMAGALQPTNHSSGAAGSNAFVAKFDLNEISPAPLITPGRAGPIYSPLNAIQPGAWMSIFGQNLAATTETSNGYFVTSLGGTSLTINGQAAYLCYVSPTQINLEAPDDMTTGQVPVVLTTTGGASTASVMLTPYTPSWCLLDTGHVAGIILRSDGSGSMGGGTYDILGPTGNSFGYATVAAKPGDVLVMYAVGFGPTNPAVPAGKPFQGAAPVTSQIAFSIGGVPVVPSFVGISSPGLYQVNLTVPAGAGTGDVPLVATVGGFQTQTGVVVALR